MQVKCIVLFLFLTIASKLTAQEEKKTDPKAQVFNSVQTLKMGTAVITTCSHLFRAWVLHKSTQFWGHLPATSDGRKDIQ